MYNFPLCLKSSTVTVFQILTTNTSHPLSLRLSYPQNASHTVLVPDLSQSFSSSFPVRGPVVVPSLHFYISIAGSWTESPGVLRQHQPKLKKGKGTGGFKGFRVEGGSVGTVANNLLLGSFLSVSVFVSSEVKSSIHTNSPARLLFLYVCLPRGVG